MDINKNFKKLVHNTALEKAKNLATEFNSIHKGKKFKLEDVNVTDYYYTSITQEVVPFLCSGDKLYLSKPAIVEMAEDKYNMKVDKVLELIDKLLSEKDSIVDVKDYGDLCLILPVNEYLDVAEEHVMYLATMASNFKLQFPTVDFEVDSELVINPATNNIVPFKLIGAEINNTPNTIKPTRVVISMQSLYLIWTRNDFKPKKSLHEFTELCMMQLYRILNTGIVEPMLAIHSLESHHSTGNF